MALLHLSCALFYPFSSLLHQARPRMLRWLRERSEPKDSHQFWNGEYPQLPPQHVCLFFREQRQFGTRDQTWKAALAETIVVSCQLWSWQSRESSFEQTRAYTRQLVSAEYYSTWAYSEVLWATTKSEGTCTAANRQPSKTGIWQWVGVYNEAIWATRSIIYDEKMSSSKL